MLKSVCLYFFAVSANPSWLKMQQLYYYSGNAHESSVQETIKSQFHGLLTSFNLQDIFCENPCNKDAFTVTPGITGNYTLLSHVLK